MFNIEEMNKWNYYKAWEFFTNNAFNRYIPETELYVRSLKFGKTIDLRDDKDARKKILESIKPKTLILFDGGTLNGKTTFAERLARNIGAQVVDIDIICKKWLDQKIEKLNDFERYLFALKVDELTSIYILKNLENIIKAKSNNSVILVGSYMEVIYRSIIVKTLGKYFSQAVSIYCCSKTFKEVEMMLRMREKDYGVVIPDMKAKALEEYNYSKRLLASDGLMLSLGMEASFIADITVSNMFV